MLGSPLCAPAGDMSWTLHPLFPARSALPDCRDVIVVDGGSTDATVRRARKAGARVVASAKGRARQMNAGAGTAKGDVLLFLHADTTLPAG